MSSALTANDHISPLTKVAKRLASRDDGVVRRAAKGERRAFSELVAAHKNDLYRFVRRRAADADEAYDIVQEAFIAAWGAIERVDPERPFGAWLRTIALNKCRDHARRRAVRRALHGRCPEGAAERVADSAPSPEEEVVANGDYAALARELAALPDHLRQALTLTAVDGLSQAAAGAVLGCSVKSIEYRVLRAREILASKLGKADER